MKFSNDINFSKASRLDYALEETIIKYPGFKDSFADYFIKNGFNSNYITRKNGARDAVIDLTTEDVLIEILKHANHAKERMFDNRIDKSLYTQYPFLSADAMLPLEYASYGEENLRNLIDFFINTRYSMTVYNKNCVDTLEIILSCRDIDREVDEYFKEQRKNKRK